jgi:hypothetical protein
MDGRRRPGASRSDARPTRGDDGCDRPGSSPQTSADGTSHLCPGIPARPTAGRRTYGCGSAPDFDRLPLGTERALQLHLHQPPERLSGTSLLRLCLGPPVGQCGVFTG